MDGFVNAARKIYDELGFDTLPLLPQSKSPYARAWQRRLPYSLWQNAPESANIGIRGGGFSNVAIIDCDESKKAGTFESVTNYIAGLGYRNDSYPVVQTASGAGRHIYVTLSGVLPGDARNLSNEFGKGEFRYGPGAFAVAPPSLVNDGRKYSLLSGDFQIRPTLEVKDILPLLCNKEITSKQKPTMPRLAYAILHGKESDRYLSRSEAEQAALVSLANAGFELVDVQEVFDRYPGQGKYAELKAKSAKNAAHWLAHSYQEAMQWAKTHESKTRQTAKSAIAWAESTAWHGRTGTVDQLVYLAHANIAYKAGRLIYAAACRDLAELAGIGFKTAIRSTYRLCTSGLLILDKKAVADSANTYQLGQLDKVTHSLSTSIVRKCVTLSAHDAFRVVKRMGINKLHVYGLGKTAGQIWKVLQEHPASIDELVKTTGRHIKTIRRVINRMANLTDQLTGEYMPMVARDDGGIYHPLPVDLDRIAHAVGTAGTGERQRQEHAKERRLHAHGLLKGRDVAAKQTSPNGDSEEV